MKEYRVTWVIDLHANSPREAAEAAQVIQRDPDSTASVFKVQEIEEHRADHIITKNDGEEFDLDSDDAAPNLYTVERIESDHGSIIVGIARDSEGKLWRFGGDHRPMQHIVDALAAGELVEVELDDWQLLGPVAEE